MKIGDKVRFLDAIGGGVVKGFQGKNVVLIEDDNGFDIPTLISDCIVIEPAQEAQVRTTTRPTAEVQQQAVAPQPKEIYIPEETKEGEQINVYLAYLANELKSLSTSNFECYLVNDSNYYLSYTYANKAAQGWSLRKAGVIEPNTKLYIETFEKDELNDLENISFQAIAYKEDKAFALKNSFSVDIKLNTVKFYKLHSFQENDYFNENAIIYPVIKSDLPIRKLSVSVAEVEEAMFEKEERQVRPRIQRITKKEAQKAEIIEIDLHIDELLETSAGMSNGEILEYQIKTFREVMEENKKHKGQKIVFIHGKGEGVLKKAIYDDLKSRYKSAYHQDASFQEYGYGATMVTIK